MKVIIMAGGSGERLWPLSRAHLPKQFLPIIAGKKRGNRISLLESSLRRLKKKFNTGDIYVSTAEEYKHYIENKETFGLRLKDSQVIFEPYAADTAACILLASLKLNAAADDEVLFFTPSDHYIEKEAEYFKCIQAAEKAAKKSKNLVLIGIPCSHPATGYGYIEMKNAGSLAKNSSEYSSSSIAAFREKPSLEKAKGYLKSKKYLWNSGMFFMQKKALIESFQKYAAHHYKTITKSLEYQKRGYSMKAKNLFTTLKRKSFDYAIVEKLENIQAITGTFLWEDLGSPQALASLEKADKHKNVILSDDTLSFSCHNVHCRQSFSKKAPAGKKTLILNGVSDIEVFLEDDLIYIADASKNASKKIPSKELLKKLAKKNKNLL